MVHNPIKVRLSTKCIAMLWLIYCLASSLLYTQRVCTVDRVTQTRWIGIWLARPASLLSGIRSLCTRVLCDTCTYMHVWVACSHSVRIETDRNFVSADQRSKFREPATCPRPWLGRRLCACILERLPLSSTMDSCVYYRGIPLCTEYIADFPELWPLVCRQETFICLNPDWVRACQSYAHTYVRICTCITEHPCAWRMSTWQLSQFNVPVRSSPPYTRCMCITERMLDSS